MLRTTVLTLCVAAATALTACAQQPTAAANNMHDMMRGNMPMMAGMSTADRHEMMAACMEHMQSMGSGQNNAKPAP